MNGSQVWDAYQRGEIRAIRSYCETDAVNTFLVFLRFQLLRGMLTPAQHEEELALVRAALSRTGGAHWTEFLAAWDAKSGTTAGGRGA
jgi:hypothetical protein